MFKLTVSVIQQAHILYGINRPEPLAVFTFASRAALATAYQLLMAAKTDDIKLLAEIEEEVVETKRRYVEKSGEELARPR